MGAAGFWGVLQGRSVLTNGIFGTWIPDDMTHWFTSHHAYFPFCIQGSSCRTPSVWLRVPTRNLA